MTEQSFTRRRLEAIVDDALRSAGVLGVLPTPLDAIGSVAGIRAVEPIARLASGIASPSRPILGALSFDDRTIYVCGDQAPPRRRFTEAHELAHALCPWHEAVLRLDTENELFRPVRSAVEAEANVGAGLLIFQGRRFEELAALEPPSIARALDLAQQHGASAHATLHHLVEIHPAAAALLVVGRFPSRDGSLPVWRHVCSPSFTRPLPSSIPPGTDLRDLVEAARGSGCAGAMVRYAGDLRRYEAEAYYNRHAFLLLLRGGVGSVRLRRSA